MIQIKRDLQVAFAARQALCKCSDNLGGFTLSVTQSALVRNFRRRWFDFSVLLTGLLQGHSSYRSRGSGESETDNLIYFLPDFSEKWLGLLRIIPVLGQF